MLRRAPARPIAPMQTPTDDGRGSSRARAARTREALLRRDPRPCERPRRPAGSPGVTQPPRAGCSRHPRPRRTRQAAARESAPLAGAGRKRRDDRDAQCSWDVLVRIPRSEATPETMPGRACSPLHAQRTLAHAGGVTIPDRRAKPLEPTQDAFTDHQRERAQESRSLHGQPCARRVPLRHPFIALEA